jgi:hypothetical protein
MFGLVGVCLASLSLLFFSIAGLLRLLPGVINLVRRVLRGLLILSFRFYRLLLTCVAPFFEQRLNIDIFAGLSRVIASTILSLILGLLLLALLNLPLTEWSVGLCFLHGLAVGLAWDEIERPGGLQLGAETQ